MSEFMPMHVGGHVEPQNPLFEEVPHNFPQISGLNVTDSLAVDINGDGSDDLLVVEDQSDGYKLALYSGGVNFLNTQNRQELKSFGADDVITNMEVFHEDGDGKADGILVAISTINSGESEDGAQIFRFDDETGEINFDNPITVRAQGIGDSYHEWSAVGDTNGDGVTDYAATANRLDGSTPYIDRKIFESNKEKGSGNITYVEHTLGTQQVDFDQVVRQYVGLDLDNNGTTDRIIVADSNDGGPTTNSKITVMQKEGVNWVMGDEIDLGSEGIRIIQVGAGDINHDEKQDIVFSTLKTSTDTINDNSYQEIGVIFNDGNGNFRLNNLEYLPQSIPVEGTGITSKSSAFEIADFDGDGKQDMIVGVLAKVGMLNGYEKITTYTYNEAAENSFDILDSVIGEASVFSYINTPFAVGDFDDDGDPDVSRMNEVYAYRGSDLNEMSEEEKMNLLPEESVQNYNSTTLLKNMTVNNPIYQAMLPMIYHQPASGGGSKALTQ